MWEGEEAKGITASYHMFWGQISFLSHGWLLAVNALFLSPLGRGKLDLFGVECKRLAAFRKESCKWSFVLAHVHANGVTVARIFEWNYTRKKNEWMGGYLWYPQLPFICNEYWQIACAKKSSQVYDIRGFECSNEWFYLFSPRLKKNVCGSIWLSIFSTVPVEASIGSPLTRADSNITASRKGNWRPRNDSLRFCHLIVHTLIF